MMLRRPLALLVATVAAGMCALPLACSSSDSAPAPLGGSGATAPAAGDVVAGVIMNGPMTGATITSLVSAPVDYAPPITEGPKLHWELRGASGVVAAGDVPDPRIWEAEVAGKDKKLVHYDGRSDGGAFEVRLPNVGGELVLRDEVAEIGRAKVPTLASGETSVVLARDDDAPAGAGPSPQSLTPRAVDAGAATPNAGAVKMIDHGDCPANINILIMPEGYTAGEMDAFHARAARIASDLETVPGWAQAYAHVNVWRQDVASRQSGLSDPGCKGNDPERCTDGPHARSIKNTAWNVSYGTTARRGAWWPTAPKAATWALYQRTKLAVKADVLFVLINSTDSIGAADPSQKIIVQSGSDDAGVTLGHELGHAILDLADEYDYGTCRLVGAGRSINVTKTPRTPPWAKLVTTAPVEGGDYCEKGVWRPQQECLMKSLDQPLCAVCANKLETFFAARVAASASNAACAAPKDCATDEDGACDTAFPGRNLVCSANGSGKSCCRAPFAVTKTCFSDDDCTASAGEICALATNSPDAGAAQFSCIVPSSQPCAAPAAAAGAARGR